MALKKIGNKMVESSDGFAVEYVDLHEIRYIEGNRTLVVEIEPGPNNFSVYSNSISSWLPPYEKEVFTSEKKKQIKLRIDEALAFLNVAHIME